MNIKLNEVSETLLITLNARAKDYKEKKSILKDQKSYEIASKLDYDFSKFDIAWASYYGILARAKTMDREIIKFIKKYPDTIIISIGCGLDTRFYRVDNGKINWYNLDLPEVIKARDMFFEENERVFNISKSVFDENWVQEINLKNKKVLIISEGVLMYFDEAEIKKMLEILTNNFQEFTAYFDFLYKGMIKKAKKHDALKKMNVEFKFGVKNGKEIEILSNGSIKQIGYINFTDEMKKLIPISKKIFIPMLYIFNNRMGMYQFNK